MVKTQSKIVEKYRLKIRGVPKDSKFYRTTCIPSYVAEKLLTGLPNVPKTQRKNDSPPMQTMVGLAKRYNGYLKGFVHVDKEIMFDQVILKITHSGAIKLVQKYDPDKYGVVTLEDVPYYPKPCIGMYWFWWD